MPQLSLSINTGSVDVWRNVSSSLTLEVWKPGNVSGMIRELKIGLARGEMTGVTSDCCQSQDGEIASSSYSVSAAYFCTCLFGRKMDGLFVQNLTVAGLAFKKYDWRPSKHEGVLH